MKTDNFYVVQGWMVKDLGLRGNDLAIYAIIYGFSQSAECGEDQWFTGSRSYLAEWTGGTKQGVSKNLNNLVERGLIEKRVRDINGVKFCAYRANRGSAQSCRVGNSVDWGGQLSCPHNIEDNKVLPPNTRYSIEYGKETSYGIENTKNLNNLTGEYLVYPPEGEQSAAAQSSDQYPFEAVKELYNSICTALPKCERLTNKRKAAIRARFKEGFTLADFERAFREAQANNFLKGENDRKWKANFDFLIAPSIVKVLEGAYGSTDANVELNYGFGEIKGYEDGSDGSYKNLGEYEF